MSIYQAGKKGGSTTADMGKKTPATFSKVSASAGQSSGTKRDGDKSGCAPMGKGK